MVTQCVADEPIRLVGALDGKTALEMALREDWDLILLDLRLPGIDGFKFMRELKSYPAKARIPVIVLTGWNTTKDLLQSFECGAVDFVTKPFKVVELRARIQATLRTKNLQAELEQSNKELV